MINPEQKINLLKAITPFFSKILKCCQLCPRLCNVDRTRNKKGYCGENELKIFTFFLHKGEEPPISGERGSGTVFFSSCNLKCIYCQNYRFSHLKEGRVIEPEELSGIMLQLQKEGAHNINLVTPTHLLPQILKALSIAYKKGLSIPLVYNTSGYERPEIVKLLKGLVDIYLVDIKYFSSRTAQKYSSAKDYPYYNQRAILEMKSQIEEFKFNPSGVMEKGLILRHLVLPTHILETFQILRWIKKNVSSALLSLMSQYRPYFKAIRSCRINTPLNPSEYQKCLNLARELRLNGFFQEEPDESFAGIYFSPGG